MVNANADALGIIFPNSYDDQVPDLVNERLMASIPFASRYRMVDFILSSMVNCGIGNVSIIVRKNYHSLMDHLGSGREWDLARKKGGLNIVPPYSEKKIQVYSGRVEALANVLDFLKWQYRQKNMAGNFENVGYSREGKAGIYNILIMEEKQSILAAGAGASTKFVFEHGERIERVENVKDLKNYVERIDEMIERKRIGMEKYLPK